MYKKEGKSDEGGKGGPACDRRRSSHFRPKRQDSRRQRRKSIEEEDILDMTRSHSLEYFGSDIFHIRLLQSNK